MTDQPRGRSTDASADRLFVWQKNLLHTIETHDVAILHGNIRDLYVYREPPQHYEVSLEELLTRLLFPQLGPIRRYDPYAKASDLSLGQACSFLDTPQPD